MDVVTGAFGFIGRHIARRLISKGRTVKTLTGHPERSDGFGDELAVAPFAFDRPDELVESLRGAKVLYNTYWIRFPYSGMTFEKAVENSEILIRAAEEAGVRRMVHISITNPSEDSPLPYYSGKAAVEGSIRRSRLSYAILRPNVVFGDEGILINNIACFLRRYPIFAVPGSGEYKVQPIYAEDLAELAVRLGDEEGNTILDAVGPEVYAFNDLVRLIAESVGSRSRVVHVHPAMALLLARVLGWVVKDVVLTRDEITGLMDNLLVSDQPPTGWTRLSEWLKANADCIGTVYMSEVGKHYR